MSCHLKYFFLLTVLLVGPIISFSQVPKSVSTNDLPVQVSLCQLAADPGSYNQKLIEVTGFASRGFEDSTLFDPACSSRFGIWLEVGGKGGTGVMYCCGVAALTKRAKDLVVENIKTSLIDDDLYSQFTRTLTEPTDAASPIINNIAHATLAGRFFSGKPQKGSRGVWPR